jgi:hypothetical protein
MPGSIPVSTNGSAGSRFSVFLTILLIAAGVVSAIGLMTNRMVPAWDMTYYIDLAIHAILHNDKLIVPFAYRPGAPLLIGFVARAFHLDIVQAFRLSAYLGCVAFIVFGFYFAASLGVAVRSALAVALAFAVFIFVIKWNLFAGAMVDIYAYPLILLAMWALLQRRYFLCAAISGLGLFFKEFMLLPLLTQAAVVSIDHGIKEWRKAIWPLAATLGTVALCFVLPRALIHVVGSMQIVDPINNPASLNLLRDMPSSWKRDFNIVYSYLAFWLPVLLMASSRRLKIVRERWRGMWAIAGFYMFFLFWLVMYGGTNIMIFVSYSLPVAIMVLAPTIQSADVPGWEPFLMVAVVFAFNRNWAHVPLATVDVTQYLDFWSGYDDVITPHSYLRMGELIAWVLSFWMFRGLLGVWSRARHRAVSGSEI